LGAGGGAAPHDVAAVVLVVLVTVAFFGLTASSTQILFTRPPRSLSAAAGAGDRGEPSVWMVVPAVAGIAVLFILGLHPPGELTELISRAVTQLGAVR
jgi:hydrogenase-4 component F